MEKALEVALVEDTNLKEPLGLSEADDPSSVTQEVQRQQEPALERVINVPLAVTLRFGQRHLTLREVLALTTGSLVELDRQVEEPVELVLGERLIARGEVVIVDGNYGLRVTEVIESAAHRAGRIYAAALNRGETTGAPA